MIGLVTGRLRSAFSSKMKRKKQKDIAADITGSSWHCACCTQLRGSLRGIHAHAFLVARQAVEAGAQAPGGLAALASNLQCKHCSRSNRFTAAKMNKMQLVEADQ